MAAPGVAVPGSVVAIGSQASPAGPQGIQGPAVVSSFFTKTAAYTLTSADSGKYVICSGGSWTLTIPAPASGLVFQVRNDQGISGTTGTITLSPTGGTIDGLASIPLLPGQECTILTDGTNWRTFGKQRVVILGTQDITSSTASGTVLLPIGYRYYELQLTGLVPVTVDDSLFCQFSTNGGSSWLTTSYYYGQLFNSSSSAASFNNVENTTQILLVPSVIGSSLSPAQAKIVIYPGSAAQWPSLEFDSGSRRSAPYQCKFQGYGICAQVGPINAIKYYMSAGNITNSFLTAKGIV